MDDEVLQDIHVIDTSDSTETCKSIVHDVMLDHKLFYNKEIIKLIQELKVEKDLKFGEIIIVFLLYLKPKVTPDYFKMMYYAGRRFEELYDEYVWNISEDEVEAMMKDDSRYKKHFCELLYRKIKKSEYNTEYEEIDKKMNLDLFGRRQSYKEYVASATFPSNYECQANIRFETFFKYWLSSMQNKYSEAFLRTNYSAYAKLESLASRPYRLVRSSDILKCIRGYTLSQRNHVIRLYRAVDKYAYEKDLIPKQYAKDLKPHKICENNITLFTSEDVQALLCHRGEISVDITLVFLYTGLALREISYLERHNIDNQYLLIKGTTKSSHRRIAIHPFIWESLQSVIDYKASISINGVLEERHKARIKRMVVEATEKYCSKKYSPIDCRRAFTNQLLVTGATRTTVEYLRGTQLELIYPYERMYTHQSTDCLKKAIMNLSWDSVN